MHRDDHRLENDPGIEAYWLGIECSLLRQDVARASSNAESLHSGCRSLADSRNKPHFRIHSGYVREATVR